MVRKPKRFKGFDNVENDINHASDAGSAIDVQKEQNTAPARQDSQSVQEPRPEGHPTGLDAIRTARAAKTNRTENGITVYVPMEYYERIALMKMRTGIPVRDIARQAIIEFVDRHRND